jgi:hypothetical protein
VTPRTRRGRAPRPGDAESLLLDEMFSPALAATLAGEGFDVLAVAGHRLLASLSDPQIALWAAHSDRRVVTENVRDFAPLLRRGDPPLRSCSPVPAASPARAGTRDHCCEHYATG